MENQADSENYWNRSASKGFSFDDDVDDTDLGACTSVAKSTVFPTFSTTVSSDVTNWTEADNILNDDTISEASFDSTALGGALNLSIKSIINEETLNLILQEQSLDDRIIPKGVTPEEELKLLRRQIQNSLYSPSPATTAYKLLLGKGVSLEVFKSLHEKEQLLDTVLHNGGGDAVTGVLLFLKKSLNWQRFLQLLKQRPKALQHYISFLQQRQQYDEAVKLLELCGKQQEAVLLQFFVAIRCSNFLSRKQKLLQLLQRSGEVNVISPYKQIFNGTFKLLELVEKERHSLDNLVNLNSTPLEVLHACCRKHVNWKEQDLQRSISPYRLCTEQQISSAQFEWTAMHERANAQAYADLEHVFERVPTWHPIKQKQFRISFALEAAVWRLFELQAPATVLYLFLSKINNPSEKLELAQRVKCNRAIIDALGALKDATQLVQLRDSLPERSEEQFYCEKAIKALQNKRWTTDSIKLKL